MQSNVARRRQMAPALVLMGIIALSGCASPLAELEANLEAAVLAEDAPLAEEILADARWTDQRDYLLTQAGEWLVDDWKHSEDLRVRAEVKADEGCESYHAGLVQEFESRIYDFPRYRELSVSYIDGFGVDCGNLIFDFLDSALANPSFAPGDETFAILETYSWVNDSRATQLRNALDARVLNVADAVRGEIDEILGQFTTTTDDFEGTTTYVTKTTISENGANLSFPIEVRECSPRLTLEVEYRAGDWLFMDEVEFKQLGGTLLKRSDFIYGASYTGEVIASNASIRERYVTPLPRSELDILSSIEDGSPVAVRLTGETRNVDFSIDTAGIGAIKDTIELYTLLQDRQSLLGSSCG